MKKKIMSIVLLATIVGTICTSCAPPHDVSKPPPPPAPAEPPR
ncbi:MAG TPA: hypothetical protein VIM89_02965 [Mucilaginibacter sp.]